MKSQAMTGAALHGKPYAGNLSFRPACVAISLFAAFAAVAGTSGVYDNHGLDVSAAAIRCAKVGEVVFSRGFADTSVWARVAYSADCMKLEHGGALGNLLELTVTKTNKTANGREWDTYWAMRTKPMPLQAKARRFLMSFALEADYWPPLSCSGFEHRDWRNEINWYDGDGAEVGSAPLSYSAAGRGSSEIRIAGEIPVSAKSYSFQLGFDRRNIPIRNRVVYRDLKLSVLADAPRYERRGSFSSEVRKAGKVSWKARTPKGTAVKFQAAESDDPSAVFGAKFVGPDGTPGTFFTAPFTPEKKYFRYSAMLESDGRATPVLESVTVGGRTDCNWSLIRDVEPPLVHLASNSPFEDPMQELAFEFVDESPVLMESVRVVVDGADRTADVRKTANGIALAAPSGGWTNGLHEARVRVSDCLGHEREALKQFYRGPMPKRSRTTLRKDGIALLDGKPLFPVGIMNVTKSPFNRWDFDCAAEGLAKAGFNMLHTWWNPYSQNFRDVLDRYGMVAFVGIRGATPFAMGPGRDAESIMAWYIGDDTIDTATQGELYDRHENMKAVAPNQLTTHASGMFSSVEASNYRPYVNAADVFMPETYPVLWEDSDSSSNCAAIAARDVEKFLYETRLVGDGAPHAVWPIIQNFEVEGRLWKGPTKAEFRAMCYAVVAAGAHGVMVYVYKDDPKWCRGVTATEERWNMTKAVVGELRELSPVLVDDSPAPEVTVQALNGPARNAFGRPSVLCLVKRHGNATYVIAVNTTRSEIPARLKIIGPRNVSRAEELFSGKKSAPLLPVLNDNTWKTFFPALGVRVFKLVDDAKLILNNNQREK